MRYLKQAFETVCESVVAADVWYVTLLEHQPFYGGPEEGGWWGEDVDVVAYQEFASEELAKAAAVRVLHLAAELEDEERRSYGEHCLQSMEWLEARGLDADFLPEPDGHAKYSVNVSQTIPASTRGCRSYS